MDAVTVIETNTLTETSESNLEQISIKDLISSRPLSLDERDILDGLRNNPDMLPTLAYNGELAIIRHLLSTNDYLSLQDPNNIITLLERSIKYAVSKCHLPIIFYLLSVKDRYTPQVSLDNLPDDIIREIALMEPRAFNRIRRLNNSYNRILDKDP